MSILLKLPPRYTDPRFHEYVHLTEDRILRRPSRRNNQRPLAALVGGEAELQTKESGYWRTPAQSWADQEIAPGVPRCPATFGDHQWPSHRQQVRLRFRMGVIS